MADGVEVSSELSKIAKLNEEFRKNYGTLLGAFLYLRSIGAAGVSLGRIDSGFCNSHSDLGGKAVWMAVR